MSRAYKGVEERDMTDVDKEEREQEQDLRVRNNLFWKNPKASKPFLLKTRPN